MASDEDLPRRSGYDLEVDPAEVIALAQAWDDLRERLDHVRRTHALSAAEFLAPGSDPVSRQITDRLQEAVDNGEGSLRSALALVMEQIRIQAGLLVDTVDKYVDVESTVVEGMERRRI